MHFNLYLKFRQDISLVSFLPQNSTKAELRLAISLQYIGHMIHLLSEKIRIIFRGSTFSLTSNNYLVIGIILV